MSAEANVDIRALAALARIEVADAELKKLETEIPNILHFAETIKSVDVSKIKRKNELRNVMREDGEAHESGIHTEALLAEAPAVKDRRLVVKQVISRSKNKE